MTNDKQVEMALRKYAHHYASFQKEDAPQQYAGEELGLKLQIYTAYANYISTKGIEKLTRILAYSTLTLAIST